MSTEELTINLTQRDLRLISIILTCLKGELAIDFDKFASASGLKNAASARTAWHTIKKKLDISPNDGATNSRPATPANRGGKRKKAAATPGLNEGDDVDGASPTKKSKATRGKADQDVVESIEKDSDHDEIVVKKAKKTPAKGKKGKANGDNTEDG